MLKLFPRRRSLHWFTLGAVVSVITTLIYLAFFSLVFGRELSYLNIPGIILIFFVICQLIALGGYLNLSLYLTLASVGFFLGLGMFINMLGNPVGGFEDLVGALSFMMLTAIGIAAGIVAELVRFGWKKLRNR